MTTSPRTELLARLAAAAQVSIPVRAADSVRLRQPIARDAPRYVLAGNDPDIRRWTELPVPYDHSHAVDFIERAAPQGLLDGTTVAFTVADAAEDVLGVVSLHEVNPIDGSALVGYWTAPWARRRGVATAALRALAEWAVHDVGLRRLGWRAVVGNVGSLRVATGAGFIPEGTVREGLRHRDVFVDCWQASLTASDPRPPDGRHGRCSVEIAAGVWQLQPIVAAADARRAEAVLPVSACLPEGLWAVRDAVAGQAAAITALLSDGDQAWVLAAAAPDAATGDGAAAVEAGTAAVGRYARLALGLQLP